MSEPTLRQYTVRTGDTLWSIAESRYGRGQFWSWIAAKNPVARAGVLYEGQVLLVPPLPEEPVNPRARRRALPIGHAPVRIKFDGRTPLFRYVGFGVGGISGLAGELVFFRDGPVHLGELTAARLLQYKLEQTTWAENLFVEQFCPASLGGEHVCSVRSPTGPRVTQHPYEIRGPGYTITGRVGEWRHVTVHTGITKEHASASKILAVNPSQLFRMASLVLNDEPAPPGPGIERTVPLGRVLRAACPSQIAPATLWLLAPDESFFIPPEREEAPPADATATPPPAAQSEAVPTLPSRPRSGRKARRPRPAREAGS